MSDWSKLGDQSGIRRSINREWNQDALLGTEDSDSEEKIGGEIVNSDRHVIL